MAFFITREEKKQYLQAGFQLANYIVLDKEKAIEITRKSMLHLKKIWLAQEKRKYYRNATRFEKIKSTVIDFFTVHESKTNFSQEQLFQLLIYYNCGKYISVAQKNVENALTFYLMHIVKEAIKNNSFYTTQLNYNILYSYNLEQTIKIYEIIDPDRYIDKRPYHFKRAKQTLERRIFKQTNYFMEQNDFVPNPSFYVGAVKAILEQLNLWSEGEVGKQINCAVPKNFGKKSNGIEAFYSEHLDQKEKEYNRLHSLLDLDCHNRLVTGLHYPSSEEKLLIRKFKTMESSNNSSNNGTNSSNGNDKPMNKRNNASELSNEEMEQTLAELDRQEEEAKGVSIGSLSVIVDGITEREINLTKKQECNFQISEDIELIEVWANKESTPILLASHFLTYESFNKKKRFNFPVNENKKISLIITPLPFSEEKDGEAFFNVKIIYEDKNKFYNLNSLLKTLTLPRIPEWVTVSVISLLSVITIAIIWKLSVSKNLKLQSQIDDLQKQNLVLLENEKALQGHLQALEEQILASLKNEKNLQNKLNNEQKRNKTLEQNLDKVIKGNSKKQNLEGAIFQLAALYIDGELEPPTTRSTNPSTNSFQTKQIILTKADKYIDFTFNLSKISYEKYNPPYLVKILYYGEIENEVVASIKSIELLKKGKYLNIKTKTNKLREGQYKLSLIGKGEENLEEIGIYSFSVIRK